MWIASTNRKIWMDYLCFRSFELLTTVLFNNTASGAVNINTHSWKSQILKCQIMLKSFNFNTKLKKYFDLIVHAVDNWNIHLNILPVAFYYFNT